MRHNNDQISYLISSPQDLALFPSTPESLEEVLAYIYCKKYGIKLLTTEYTGAYNSRTSISSLFCKDRFDHLLHGPKDTSFDALTTNDVSGTPYMNRSSTWKKLDFNGLLKFQPIYSLNLNLLRRTRHRHILHYSYRSLSTNEPFQQVNFGVFSFITNQRHHLSAASSTQTRISL